MTSLAFAEPEILYTVKWNTCTGDSAALTQKLGICTGKDLLLVNSYFGNVIVNINGKEAALSKDIAVRIKV